MTEVKATDDRQFLRQIFYDDNGHCVGCGECVMDTGSGIPNAGWEPHVSDCRLKDAEDAIIARIEADRAEIARLKSAMLQNGTTIFEQDEEIARLKAEVERVQSTAQDCGECLEWLLNLLHGVGRGGGIASAAEMDAASESARSALAGYAQDGTGRAR